MLYLAQRLFIKAFLCMDGNLCGMCSADSVISLLSESQPIVSFVWFTFVCALCVQGHNLRTWGKRAHQYFTNCCAQLLITKNLKLVKCVIWNFFNRMYLRKFWTKHQYYIFDIQYALRRSIIYEKNNLFFLKSYQPWDLSVIKLSCSKELISLASCWQLYCSILWWRRFGLQKMRFVLVNSSRHILILYALNCFSPSDFEI